MAEVANGVDSTIKKYKLNNPDSKVPEGLVISTIQNVDK